MSLLLATRTQPNSGCGTILRVAIALGIPTAALQPTWLGADDFAPPAVDEGAYLPIAPAAPAPVRQAFLADDGLPSVAKDDDRIVPMLVQPSQQVVYLSWGAEDDLASVAAPIVEDEGYLPIVRQPLPPQLELFVSDTAPSAALGPYLEDGGWLAPPPWASGPPQAVWLATDDLPITPVSVVEDEGYQPSPPQQTLSTRLVWVADDEVAPHVDDDGWLAPLPWATSVPRQPIPIDEEWTAPAAPIVEDEAYLPTVRQPLPPQLWLFASDPAPSAALGPYLDDGGWLAPSPWTVPSPLPALLATDDLPIAPAPIVEDEGYQSPAPWVIPPVRLVWGAEDETPAPLHVEDSEWQATPPWPASPVPRAIPADEEWVAPPAAPIVDEEPYLPPVFVPVDNRGIPHWSYEQQGEWVPQPPPIAEDEPFVPLVRQPGPPRIHVISAPAAPALAIPPAGQPDEDYYQQLVLPPPDPITLFGPWSFASGEDTSQMPDEECWRGPIIWPVPQPALSWRDDDMPSVPVVPLGVDELHWQVPVGKPFPAPQQLPWVEDDIPSLPQVPLGVDDDSFVAALLQPLPVTLFGPWSYAADEMGSALEEDLFWTPGPLPTPRAWARLVIEQPDEWPSPPVPLRVEDDCWITALTQRQLVQPTMPPALPPWFMEQHEQAADLKKPKKPRDSIIRLHVSRDGRASIWYT